MSYYAPPTAGPSRSGTPFATPYSADADQARQFSDQAGAGRGDVKSPPPSYQPAPGRIPYGMAAGRPNGSFSEFQQTHYPPTLGQQTNPYIPQPPMTVPTMGYAPPPAQQQNQAALLRSGLICLPLTCLTVELTQCCCVVGSTAATGGCCL